MFRTDIVRRCYADSEFIEEICDGFLMERSVDGIFACAASSAAAASAAEYGFSEDEIASAESGDILLSVECRDGRAAETALSRMRSMLTAESAKSGWRGRNPEIVLDSQDSVSWALIRLPSGLAARAAVQCLDRGCGVILEEGIDAVTEAELKKRAFAAGLPLLGGGVQGAVIAGKPLGACPEFRKGSVSVLGQSLSSNLMLAFLLERRGIGIRHLISTGRRDCYREENGEITEFCLNELISDRETECICLLLKSGDLGVLDRIVERAAESGKKIFIYSVGLLKSMDYTGRNSSAASLSALADEVAAFLGNAESGEDDPADNTGDIVAIHRLQLKKQQKYLRGFFLSEAMCGETASQLIPRIGAVYSNSPVRGALLDPETRFPKENSVIDCARSGPESSSRSSMLAAVRRNRRMESEAYNRSVAVILADWYGIAGSTGKQLADTADSIRRCIQTASEDGRHLAVGAIVMAGEGSPIGPDRAAEELRRAGADVFFSADEAAAYAADIISGGKRDGRTV